MFSIFKTSIYYNLNNVVIVLQISLKCTTPKTSTTTSELITIKSFKFSFNIFKTSKSFLLCHYYNCLFRVCQQQNKHFYFFVTLNKQNINHLFNLYRVYPNQTYILYI